MSTIAEWLATLGMSEYADCFARNHIDFSVLRDLTDTDLKELGIVLGDRRKMLRAIGALAGIAAPSKLAALAAQESAERRQLTVVFCDLVGSTALSARLDPEDLRGIINDYRRACAAVVERNSGFVAKYMGDGVLAYFGYPSAHEHDAERAVRAGLALVEAVSQLATPDGSPLEVRVGIATGLVVVGDLIGSGEAQERGVIGETPNLAACLQGIAAPDMVILADGTRRLIGNLFDVEDLGRREIKGLGRTRAWAALRASSVASRFEALRTSELRALVGRREEKDFLLRRWAQAKTGAGQVVLLSGEAGIGKSRLAAALMEHLARQSHRRLRYFCSPQYTDSALYPIISQLERSARFARNETSRAKLDKLDATLAWDATPPENAALLAEMLSLPNDGRYPVLELAAQQRRQKTLDVLVTRIEMLAIKKPLLMIVEDVHWIDPTSLEVLDRIVDLAAFLRVLLIVTFRPEFESRWTDRPHVSALTINRLAEHEVGELIDSIIGSARLPADIRGDIAARTDGVPLFVEEMTKAVLEAENESAVRRAVAAVASPYLAVPASLHAPLMARLDRLGPAKEVAQIGAAIGREFSYALLAALLRVSETELDMTLGRLTEAGLLFQRGAPPQATYLFKHALVQDAAYGTLLREPRRMLHARIAEALDEHFPEIAEKQPELLAHHCSEAGLIEKAAHLWGKAGQSSLTRSALREAIVQLRRALAHIAALPGTTRLRSDEIKLQVALANALMHVKGYAAPESQAAVEQARLFIERAEAEGEPPEDPLLLFSVLAGVWAASHVAFNGDVCCDLAARFLALAEKQKSPIPRMIGHRLMGSSLLSTGSVVESLAHFDKAIALYDPAAHRALATRFAVDIEVVILGFRTQALWILGHPDGARADIGRALENAREIDQGTTSLFAFYMTELTHILCRDHDEAAARGRELAALADEKGALLWKAFAMMNHVCIQAMSGRAAEAIEALPPALAAFHATGATLLTPFYLIYSARAYSALGRFDDARGSIEEALQAVAVTRERWCEAELHRTAGEIALLAPQADGAAAAAHFARALAIARAQQAKSWELRAATSLARLWRGVGRRREAHDLLAPVFGWFTEGFGTRDLQDAKALLEELRNDESGPAKPA